MNYSEIENEILHLTDSATYHDMPKPRELGLKRVDMLLKLEGIKKLDAIEICLSRLTNRLGRK